MTEPADHVAPQQVLIMLLRLRARAATNQLLAHVPSLKRGGRRAGRSRSVAGPIALVAAAWLATVTFRLVVGAADQHTELSSEAVGGTLLLLATVLVVCGLIGRTGQDLAQREPEFDALLAYPATLTTLHAADWIWRSLTTGYAWAMLLPPLMVISAHGGHGLWSLPIAFVLTPVLSAIALLGCALLARTTRQSLSAFWLRASQSLTTLVGGLVAMLLGGAAVSHPSISVLAGPRGGQANFAGVGEFLWTLIEMLGSAIAWTPWGAAARLSAQHEAVALFTLTASTLVVLGAGWLVMAALLRAGPVEVHTAQSTPSSTKTFRPWPRGTLGWESMLFLRTPDRWGLALLTPIGLLVAIVLLDPRDLSPGLRHAFAFAVGSTVLLLATHQAHRHQKSIWLHFTLPRPIVEMFRRNAMMWFGVAAFHTTLGMIFLSIGAPEELSDLVPSAVSALACLYFMAHIGVAYNVLTTDLTVENTNSMPLAHMLLLTGVSAFCYAAIVTTDLWVRLALIALIGAFALGVWQRLVRHSPYLLDPTIDPPKALTPQDGAWMALVHGGSLVILMDGFGTWWPRYALWAGITAAAVLIPGGLYLWRRQVPDLLEVVGARKKLSFAVLLTGIGAGLAASAVFVAYVATSLQIPWIGELTGVSRATLYAGQSPSAIHIALLLVIAPICVEFIFRGLIYRSLVSRFSLPVAVGGSALLFMIVHPPVMFVPMLALGAVAALAFARTGSLATPIVVHVVFNLTLLVTALAMPMPTELTAQIEGCEAGDAEACIALGQRYRRGNRVEQSGARTIELYERACELGSPMSCEEVGWMIGHYSWGPQDKERAIEIWDEACAGGQGFSCSALGRHWYRADDSARAARLYDKACELDDSRGCYRLGDLYHRGDGVDADKNRALELFARSCDLGNSFGCDEATASH